jgi:hypothetical protein
MKTTKIFNFCLDAFQAAKSQYPYDTSDVCEFAHNLLIELHPKVNHDVQDPEGVFRYTDSSQLLFDKIFEGVELALIQSGLQRDQNSTWTLATTSNQSPFPKRISIENHC